MYQIIKLLFIYKPFLILLLDYLLSLASLYQVFIYKIKKLFRLKRLKKRCLMMKEIYKRILYYQDLFNISKINKTKLL